MPLAPLSLVTRAIFAMALSFAAAHRVHKDRAYDYEPVGAEETRAEESVGSAVAESRSFPFGEDGFGVSHADYVDAESPASNDPGNAPTLAPEQALPLPTTPPSPTETETTSNDTLVPEQEATKSNDTDTKRNDILAPTLAPPLPAPPPTPEEDEQAPPLPPPPSITPEEHETRLERERIASLPIVQRYDETAMRSMDDPAYEPGAWLLGRATYFDAPESWKKTFAPHLFGDLYGNGCGFLNKSPERRNVNRNNDNFPFPLDAVAAVADFDVRLIEGACGTCYEIGCVTGPVLHSFDQNDKIEIVQDGFYEQAPGALDSFGRVVPSRNAEPFLREVDAAADDVTKKVNQSYLAEYSRCWNETNSIFVKIVDKCPCSYFYEQTICCGPVPHFDLSYWGYEKLLHPIQGKVMIRFRPVDCATRVPVDARLGAAGRMDAVALEGMEGVLTKADSSGQRVARWGGRAAAGELSDEDKKRKVAVFENGPSPGWLINSYGDWYVSLFAAGMGLVVVDSSVSSVGNDTNATVTTTNTNNATCAVLQPGGRLLVRCEQCEKSLKPFGGNDGRVVSFFVRIAPYIEQLPVPPGTNSTSTWWEPSLDMTACIDSQIWPGDSPVLYLGVSTTGAFDFALEKPPDEVPCGKKSVVKHEGPCGVRAVVDLEGARCVGRAAERANSVFLELGQGNDDEHVVCVDDMFVESTK